MSRPERRLVSLRRPVADALAGEHDRLWSALRAAAEAANAHAWRFTALDDPGLRLEFLEFAEGADPRSRAAIVDLLTRLDAEIGRAEVEEWREC